MKKKTKIVCTIGPASESPEVLEKLMLAGMNVCRLNFSHGIHEEHQEKIDTIKEVAKKLDKHIAIMSDLKGPEIRLGDFEDDQEISLKTGDKFTFTTRELLGNQEIVSVTHKGLPDDVEVGTKILVDDGLVEFEVESIVGSDIHTKVLNDGEISNHKGVNVPGANVSLPAITEKDRNDILFSIENDVEFIAGSFIRKKEDVQEIRKILEENGGEEIQIISKIENQEGVENLDDIIHLSDGIMVARGDLGVEIPAEDMPLVQKDMIRRTHQAGKPVITATQMLDSMIRNPRPTRAEVTDVANAIIDGTSAIMLSGETASGKYPVRAVEMMTKIAKNIENNIDYDLDFDNYMENVDNKITYSVSHSACVLAENLKAGAIIAATASGYTAREISKFRPKTPIIAATPSEKVCRRMALSWGVEPLLVSYYSNEELVAGSLKNALEEGLVEEGEIVVITAGIPTGESGSTNLIKVETAAHLVARGLGIGRDSVSGKAVVARDVSNLEEKFEDGDIIVVSAGNKSMVEYMERSGGIVVEKGGLTSHAAIVGLELKIPTIIGVREATSLIEDGSDITIDAAEGHVYSGNIEIK